MLNIIKKLLDLLTPREKDRGVILLLMISLMALLDVLGVASIMPFIAILSNPSLIESNYYLKYFLKNLGLMKFHNFSFMQGCLFL